MNYFDYIRMLNLKDTKDNFISYLVDIIGDTEKEAIKYANFIYREEKED